MDCIPSRVGPQSGRAQLSRNMPSEGFALALAMDLTSSTLDPLSATSLHDLPHSTCLSAEEKKIALYMHVYDKCACAIVVWRGALFSPLIAPGSAIMHAVQCRQRGVFLGSRNIHQSGIQKRMSASLEVSRSHKLSDSGRPSRASSMLRTEREKYMVRAR